MKSHPRDANLEQVLLELVSASETLNHSRLQTLMAQYPHYRRDIQEFAVAWVMEDPPPVPPEMCEAERERLTDLALRRLGELFDDPAKAGGVADAPKIPSDITVQGANEDEDHYWRPSGNGTASLPIRTFRRSFLAASCVAVTLFVILFVGMWHHKISFSQFTVNDSSLPGAASQVSEGAMRVLNWLNSGFRAQSRGKDLAALEDSAPARTPPLDRRETLSQANGALIVSGAANGPGKTPSSEVPTMSPVDEPSGQEFRQSAYLLPPTLGSRTVIVNSPGPSLDTAMEALKQLCTRAPNLKLALWKVENRDGNAALGSTSSPNKTYAIVAGTGLSVEQVSELTDFLKPDYPDVYSIVQRLKPDIQYECSTSTMAHDVSKNKAKTIYPSVTRASFDID